MSGGGTNRCSGVRQKIYSIKRRKEQGHMKKVKTAAGKLKKDKKCRRVEGVTKLVAKIGFDATAVGSISAYFI